MLPSEGREVEEGTAKTPLRALVDSGADPLASQQSQSGAPIAACLHLPVVRPAVLAQLPPHHQTTTITKNEDITEKEVKNKKENQEAMEKINLQYYTNTKWSQGRIQIQ